ncbi:MAG TPA: DoxX family protein [Gammaproteobacteria bacterium]|nr:DoxX family protein [Gammaproteobacteria bacterium]
MTGAEIAYFAARVLTCGIWIAAGLHKATHYRRNIVEMTHLGVPLPSLVLPCVLVMEIVGAAMLILNYHVWAAALVWLVFLVPASYVYHFRFMVRDGTIDFGQFVTGWKNVSIAGGLIALILLDASRPAWLFPS